VQLRPLLRQCGAEVHCSDRREAPLDELLAERRIASSEDDKAELLSELETPVKHFKQLARREALPGRVEVLHTGARTFGVHRIPEAGVRNLISRRSQ